ncbi:sporulation protein YpjB [Halobacillus salinarum]|uniref:Sporulation protein YpjB n=1 Tax=Halobacillus salinarum TaxID=2932257 RepID=A0ABY4EFG6_9BACI|nr:sporulation protein YpjB [Halobacillus salinarum]UOQ42725.1 sporulation protein YpjB [Halobacillus salinarum]
MGRAMLLSFITVIFTLMPLITYGQMNTKSNDWDSFVSQYRLLVNDGKVELADRMLNNRLPDMEKYTETLPVKQREVWQKLVTPLLNHNEGTPLTLKEAEPFLKYMDTLSFEDPAQKVNEIFKDWENQLKQQTITSTELVSDWEALKPTASVFYSTAGLKQFSSSLEEWKLQNSDSTREQLVFSLNELIREHPAVLDKEAFLITAIFVIGAILLTLAYVGIRKFIAEKEKNKVRDNSIS